MLSVDEIKDRIQLPSARNSGNVPYDRDFKKNLLIRKIENVGDFCMYAKDGRISEYLQRQFGRTTDLMIAALSQASGEVPICYQGGTHWSSIQHFQNLQKFAIQFRIDPKFILNATTRDRRTASILYVDHYIRENGLAWETFHGQIIHG